MSEIIEAASRITTPIALAAITVTVLFLLYKALIAKGGNHLLILIVKYVFVIALVATCLSITGYIWIETWKSRNEPVQVVPREEHVIKDIELKDAPLAEIFNQIASQIDAVAAVDPKVTGTLSLSVESGKVKDVMNEICRELRRCSWRIQEGSPPALMVLPYEANLQ